jgi:hypothetical protein
MPAIVSAAGCDACRGERSLCGMRRFPGVEFAPVACWSLLIDDQESRL